ncbi:MAG: hypothetical protein ACN0LA_11150 [Candidatus Longimicrobiales bacterium M2_2A_002]
MKKRTITVLAMLAFGATNVAAQATASQSATATVTIPSVLAINVTNTSIAFNPNAANFAAGFVAGESASGIQTRGNVSHDLTIEADDGTFTYSGTETPAPTKAASDLLWSTDGTNFNPISTTQQALGTFSRGVNSAATVYYRVALDYLEDAPGEYTLGFTYTITAN